MRHIPILYRSVLLTEIARSYFYNIKDVTLAKSSQTKLEINYFISNNVHKREILLKCQVECYKK